MFMASINYPNLITYHAYVYFIALFSARVFRVKFQNVTRIPFCICVRYPLPPKNHSSNANEANVFTNAEIKINPIFLFCPAFLQKLGAHPSVRMSIYRKKSYHGSYITQTWPL